MTQRRRRTVRRLDERLDERFGGAAWDRTRRRPDPLDDLVRTILSQNTTDENRDRAFRALREALPDWEDVLAASPSRIKELIRPAGLVNTKGPAIRNVLRWLERTRGRLDLGFLKELDADEGIEILTAHKGVGLKTAYIVLAFACDKDLCAVDTHVHRILRRLDLIDASCGREKAHDVLRPMIPEGRARILHINMIDFGKTICTARRPSCGDCPMRRSCTWYRSLKNA